MLMAPGIQEYFWQRANRMEKNMRNKVTVPAILARKNGPRITMVTAYDAPSAQIVDRAGVDIILVGDSVATVVLGYANTLLATCDTMIHHAAAVTRTHPTALL